MARQQGRRGDRDGLEEFNGAFVGLQGADATLTAQEMQEFESFLATLHFQPNPHRNFDNTLPTSLFGMIHRVESLNRAGCGSTVNTSGG